MATSPDIAMNKMLNCPHDFQSVTTKMEKNGMKLDHLNKTKYNSSAAFITYVFGKAFSVSLAVGGSDVRLVFLNVSV